MVSWAARGNSSFLSKSSPPFLLNQTSEIRTVHGLGVFHRSIGFLINQPSKIRIAYGLSKFFAVLNIKIFSSQIFRPFPRWLLHFPSILYSFNLFVSSDNDPSRSPSNTLLSPILQSLHFFLLFLLLYKQGSRF